MLGGALSHHLLQLAPPSKRLWLQTCREDKCRAPSSSRTVGGHLTLVLDPSLHGGSLKPCVIGANNIFFLNCGIHDSNSRPLASYNIELHVLTSSNQKFKMMGKGEQFTNTSIINILVYKLVYKSTN